ncbi:hypothetical protein EJB05_30178, partial [Eragrostis curvula]
MSAPKGRSSAVSEKGKGRSNEARDNGRRKKGIVNEGSAWDDNALNMNLIPMDAAARMKELTGVKLPHLNPVTWSVDILDDSLCPEFDRNIILCGMCAPVQGRKLIHSRRPPTNLVGVVVVASLAHIGSSSISIYGTVDFVFGNAAAVLQRCTCTLWSRSPPLPGKDNTVTAQGRCEPCQDTGLVLHHCRILPVDSSARSPAAAATYLGRPWRPYSRVVMLSYIGPHVPPRGWNDTASYALDTLYFGEYRNVGPGAGVGGRVAWREHRVIADDAEAERLPRRGELHRRRVMAAGHRGLLRRRALALANVRPLMRRLTRDLLFRPAPSTSRPGSYQVDWDVESNDDCCVA